MIVKLIRIIEEFLVYVIAEDRYGRGYGHAPIDSVMFIHHSRALKSQGRIIRS